MKVIPITPGPNAIVVIGGTVLLVLTLLVSIPMTILTIRSHGGVWGFEMIGLAVLSPLCSYALFGVAGFCKAQSMRRTVFLTGHVVSVVLGSIYCIVFPVYPVAVIIVPLAFAALGFADQKNLDYYLMLMQLLGIAANTMLLIWELNDGKTIPLFELLGW